MYISPSVSIARPCGQLKRPGRRIGWPDGPSIGGHRVGPPLTIGSFLVVSEIADHAVITIQYREARMEFGDEHFITEGGQSAGRTESVRHCTKKVAIEVIHLKSSVLPIGDVQPRVDCAVVDQQRVRAGKSPRPFRHL